MDNSCGETHAVKGYLAKKNVWFDSKECAAAAVTVLTRPGAEGCYYCHSAGQHAGFSVLPRNNICSTRCIFLFNLEPKKSERIKENFISSFHSLLWTGLNWDPDQKRASPLVWSWSSLTDTSITDTLLQDYLQLHLIWNILKKEPTFPDTTVLSIKDKWSCLKSQNLLYS